MYKAHQRRTTFGSWDVEKVYAIVARSSFPSQKCKKVMGSDHFWKLKRQKSVRHCGVKHVSKSKCTRHIILRPLLEVEMSKKCTPLWREVHFQVKMHKTHQRRTTFGSWDVVLRGRRKGLRTLSNVSKKTWGFCSSFNYNYNSNTLHYITRNYATLHNTPLHYTTLHPTTLPNITLHYTPLHYTPLPTLRYTTVHYTAQHYITLHFTTLVTVHNTTILQYIPLRYIPPHYTLPHYTTWHYT